jgi:hypothetical protein
MQGLKERANKLHGMIKPAEDKKKEEPKPKAKKAEDLSWW